MANGLWSNSCQVQAALCGIELAPPAPRGGRSALTEIYPTGDGRHFMLAILTAREWPLLARAVGRNEWIDDPLFATPLARFSNAALLVSLLEEIFLQRPWEHWNEVLTEAGIAFGLVARIDDHIADPQIEANALLPEFVDGYGLRTVDSPFKVAGEVKAQPRMAPDIGQHTLQILEEVGCSPEDIAALTAA
jgi:formyl-CoA transferase